MKKALIGIAAIAALALPVFASAPDSGLKVGEMTSAFEPHHVSGPDKGTDTCPVCKYGNRPAVQVWVNGDAPENVVAIANDLDKKMASSKAEFRAFVVYLTHCEKCVEMSGTIAGKVKGEKVAVTNLPIDSPAVGDYKVNTDTAVKNTVFVYKNRKVVAKFVNLKGDEAGLKALNAAIAKVDN
ncbi:MAG: hypothetical protein KF824_04815 [Fimbriimonadaceae bacterium]|nr:hypothetical protein [Fimbriimonadaceae bacterium]QYK54221.1 MAG: hypothetical protein KF824_04815 [Fimbriimonadaceae bacterium]